MVYRLGYVTAIILVTPPRFQVVGARKFEIIIKVSPGGRNALGVILHELGSTPACIAIPGGIPTLD